MAALANSKVQYVSSALWASVAAYPSAGSVAAGVLCTNTANSPAVGSERVFVCTAGGITAGTAPTFTNTKGAITEDALTTIFWQECTGQPGVNGDITNSPVWAQTLTVVLGQIIYDSGTGSLQIANQAFTTHTGAAPTFSATAGTTSTGQDVGKWTSLGLASAFGKFAAPHARILNADAATWQTVVPAQIFIDSNHAETNAGSLTIGGGQGTTSSPNQYLSVSASGAIPPTSCTAGASLNTTGANGITANGYGYYFGISLISGASISFQGSGGAGYAQWENGTIKLNNATAGSTVGFDNLTNAMQLFTNMAIVFGAAGQSIGGSAGSFQFIMKGGSIALTGTAPTNMMSPGVGGSARAVLLQLRDVDISGCSGALCSMSNVTGGDILIDNCKLNASATMTAGTFTNAGTARFRLHNCDSGSKNYRFFEQDYCGSITQETTIVRTGGATDGVTPISWNITPTAKALFGQPFATEYLPVARYNALVTGSHTATIYINTDASLTNGNFWAELECLDTSGFPIGTLVTSRIADPLTSASALTSDTSTWASAKANKYSIVLTFSPAMAGVIKVRLFAATGSTTPIYVDPNVILDSLTSARQYLLPGMGYANAEASSGGMIQSRVFTGM